MGKGYGGGQPIALTPPNLCAKIPPILQVRKKEHVLQTLRKIAGGSWDNNYFRVL